MINELIGKIKSGDRKALSRGITIVENDLPGSEEILSAVDYISDMPVIGITGPPGAGKSTLINALLKHFISQDDSEKIAVIAVDPTSPFTHGSLLGDRLRMNEHHGNPNIYIRSLATRGALGGLSAKALEITDILKLAGFNRVIIETVGVGQSEIDIVSLADCTVVVLVPESGDEIQAIKSGIMEIADVFAVNKSDREGADKFASLLMKTLHDKPGDKDIQVIKTSAVNDTGVNELSEAIRKCLQPGVRKEKNHLLAEKAFRYIQQKRMKDITVENLRDELEIKLLQPGFNFYRFISEKS